MNATPSPVTAIILTLNEAGNLPRCIASLRWCREVLVIDSGSSDETCTVAKKLGARVLLHKPEGRFLISEQRNWVLVQGGISTPWVLFIDADEEVPEDLAKDIITRCTDEKSSFHAYELTPRYLFWGRWLKLCQGYPNWHARLLRLGTVVFSGGVWEQFDKREQVGCIQIPYNHYANSKGLSDWLERHDRYSTWDAEKIVAYLNSGQTKDLETGRKLQLRILAAKLWPLRPLARWFHMYVWRLGFLEGFPGFVFCLLLFFYEVMVVVKVIELKRRHAGQPL